MEKEIRWSDHAKLKLNILKQRSLKITPEQVIETIRSPDATFTEDEQTIVNPSTVQPPLKISSSESKAIEDQPPEDWESIGNP